MQRKTQIKTPAVVVVVFFVNCSATLFVHDVNARVPPESDNGDARARACQRKRVIKVVRSKGKSPRFAEKPAEDAANEPGRR